MLCASGPRFLRVVSVPACLRGRALSRMSYFLPPAARASRIHFSKPFAGRGLL